MEMFDGSIPGELLEVIENCDHDGMQIYKDEGTKTVYIGICPKCGLYSEFSEEVLNNV